MYPWIAQRIQYWSHPAPNGLAISSEDQTQRLEARGAGLRFRQHCVVAPIAAQHLVYVMALPNSGARARTPTTALVFRQSEIAKHHGSAQRRMSAEWDLLVRHKNSYLHSLFTLYGSASWKHERGLLKIRLPCKCLHFFVA